jgi:5'-nucleotidase / UDP-sugar diphosphatase
MLHEKSACAVYLWALIGLLIFPGLCFAGSSQIELTILHINDVHGHILPRIEKSVDEKNPIGGAAYLAGMIAAERSGNPEGTLLFSAGDMFQGTPISNVFCGKPVIEIMNKLDFDAMAVGNHEFDWGLDKLVALASSAKFPFISANITDTQGRSPPVLKSFLILRRKGPKIAAIGATTPDTPFTTKPGNVKGLVFSEPEKILPGIIAEVRKKGADLIIVVSHLGLDADRALAEKVQGIDVIVGGHSHTAVMTPVSAGGAIIVQAKCYDEYLGVLKLRIDARSKKIISYSKRNVLRKTLSGPDDAVDPVIARIVQGYNDQIKEAFAKIIGETAVDLIKNNRGESNLGDLICDAMKKASRSRIAFQNSGGIRADILRGKITLEQIFTVLPFDNDIISMDLTGEQIRAILEQNINQEHGILQVSGIRVRYDMNKPGGSRVVEATTDAGALDPEKIYRVATNDFLAAGGDRFGAFKKGKNIVYAGSVRDAVADFLKTRSPVNPKVEGRIVFQ